jgi:hypothetical protein
MQQTKKEPLAPFLFCVSAFLLLPTCSAVLRVFYSKLRRRYC